MDVSAIVLGTVGPGLHTLAVLFILLPVAVILCTVQVAVDAVAVRLVIEPHAIIHGAIDVDESSAAVGLVLAPPALVHGTIWPNLLSFTSSNISLNKPLSLELGLVL